MGRSHAEIRSQTIIAKRTLVRAMINADSLKTNRQAMEDLMRLLLEELEAGASTANGNTSSRSQQHERQSTKAKQPTETSSAGRPPADAAAAADSNGASQPDGRIRDRAGFDAAYRERSVEGAQAGSAAEAQSGAGTGDERSGVRLVWSASQGASTAIRCACAGSVSCGDIL